MIGRSIYDFIDPRERDPVRARLSSVLEGKPLSEGTRGTFVRSTGERIVGETTGALIDFDGLPAVLAITRDVTARARAEEALRESEKRFRDLADLLPQNVWECDLEGRLTFVNHHSLEMYGYTMEDFHEGLFIPQMMHPDDRSAVMGDFIEGIGREPREFPTHHEYRALRKDGSTFPVLMYHVPTVRDNRIVGMRGIGIDLTERKQGEAALRGALLAFQNIAENSVDIISRIRVDGTCMYVSPAVRSHLGYNPEEVTGRIALEYLHPDDLGRVLAAIRAFGTNGSDTGTDTFRMRHKDGSYIWFEASIRASRDPVTGKIAEFTMVSRFIEPREDRGSKSQG
jgi:PAS domain S-box-containing protein